MIFQILQCFSRLICLELQSLVVALTGVWKRLHLCDQSSPTNITGGHSLSWISCLSLYWLCQTAFILLVICD